MSDIRQGCVNEMAECASYKFVRIFGFQSIFNVIFIIFLENTLKVNKLMNILNDVDAHTFVNHFKLT